MAERIVYISNEENLTCPNDWASSWRLYSFCSRHNSYKHPTKLGLSLEFGPDRLPIVKHKGLRSKFSRGLAFWLSYFEHGDCIWSLLDRGPRDQFDSVRVAGLLIWEHKVGVLGPREFDERQDDARDFLESYTAWANGHVYCYTIENADGETIDGCSDMSHLDNLYRFVANSVRGYEVEFHCDDYHRQGVEALLAAPVPVLPATVRPGRRITI